MLVFIIAKALLEFVFFLAFSSIKGKACFRQLALRILREFLLTLILNNVLNFAYAAGCSSNTPLKRILSMPGEAWQR
jgi:hypothetical protein